MALVGPSKAVRSAMAAVMIVPVIRWIIYLAVPLTPMEMPIYLGRALSERLRRARRRLCPRRYVQLVG